MVLFPRDVVLVQLHAEALAQLSNLSIVDDTYLVLMPRIRPLPRGALIFAEWLRSLPGAIDSSVARN